MADKVITVTQPAAIDSCRVMVTRVAGVTHMTFYYEPPGQPANTQSAEVLDSDLIAGDKANLNASLLAAYTIAKTRMGF